MAGSTTIQGNIARFCSRTTSAEALAANPQGQAVLLRQSLQFPSTLWLHSHYGGGYAPGALRRLYLHSHQLQHPANTECAASRRQRGCSTCTGTINPLIAGDLSNIEGTYGPKGATLTPLGLDPNHQNLNFPNKGATVNKYPTLRLDYN